MRNPDAGMERPMGFKGSYAKPLGWDRWDSRVLMRNQDCWDGTDGILGFLCETYGMGPMGF
jgi:hypothetical protein